MKEECYFDIKHTSLYIVVDHVNDDCIIKLLDFSYVEEYEDQDQRDEGFIFGLESIRLILYNI